MVKSVYITDDKKEAFELYNALIADQMDKHSQIYIVWQWFTSFADYLAKRHKESVDMQ